MIMAMKLFEKVKINGFQYNKYLSKQWKSQVIVILLGFVAIPLSLINPYLSKLLIDKAYGDRDLKLFLILAAVGGCVFLLAGLVTYFKSYLSRRVKCRVNHEITKDLFKHLQGFPLSFFKNRSTGEHVYKISNDVSKVSDFTCDSLPQMVTLVPRFLIVLVIVFSLNWKIALLATLLIPISAINPYFFGKLLRETIGSVVEKFEETFKKLHEVFSNVTLVKALGKEDYEIERFEKNLTKRINFELKKVKLLSLCDFSGSILNRIIIGLIALYGGYQVINGVLTLGSLTALMLYLTQLAIVAKSISGFYETFLITSVSSQRLSQILNTETQNEEAQGALDYPLLRGEINFKNISFGYKKNEPLFHELNFSIKPAAKIALVGSSGCGKTTLLNLILRLYEPEKGSIVIDNQDIRAIKRHSLKSQLGIALQEPFLWNDTVANNIIYGAPEGGKEDLVKAARMAEADRFISNLPKQYDTLLGEGACRLSEGQKQRIALARALIGKPRILLLDEAMSSLDSETEDKIIDNIMVEFNHSTLIMVSHRLSTVKKMGLVYFLETPSKMNVGTHDQLLLENKKYQGLFASQIEKQELRIENLKRQRY